jgi:hypothetical protein
MAESINEIDLERHEFFRFVTVVSRFTALFTPELS